MKKDTRIAQLRLLIDSAQKDLERLQSATFADQRAKTMFYQSFAALALGAHCAAWAFFGIATVGVVAVSAVSCALFAAVLALSVFAMSNGGYISGALLDYQACMKYALRRDEPLVDVYWNTLERYQNAVRDAVALCNRRGLMLRVMNRLTGAGCFIGCLALSTLALQY